MEAEAYWDWIRWYLDHEHAVLLSVPKPKPKNDFWVFEGDEALSFPFSSMDFARKRGPHKGVVRGMCKRKEVFERVRDLALMHSSISDEAGKKRVHERYRELVDSEFRERACAIRDALGRYGAFMDRERAVGVVDELNGMIRACNRIWKDVAGNG